MQQRLPIISITLGLVWALFLMSMAYLGYQVISFANEADVRAGHTVSTGGDAHGYQKMAVNILYGLGPGDSESLPLSTYVLDLNTPWGADALKYEREHGPREYFSHFDRPPGFPFMMAAVYSITGVQSIYARLLLAACVLGAGLALAFAGFSIDRRVGSLAGMLAALLYLSSVSSTWFDGILTEIPASFWVAVFFLFFALYERSSQRNIWWLTLSACSLVMFIFTRFNFFTTIPFLALYLWFSKAKRSHLALFILLTCAPLVIWSAYATKSLGKFTLLSTQGSGLFSTSNNIDALYGIGPDGWNRGGWNPGWIKATDGSLSCDYRHLPPDGSGWKRGLQFWREHALELPRLFYVKMEKGLWYNDGTMTPPLKPEGFLIVAICSLLFAIGHRHQVNLPHTSTPDSRGIGTSTFLQLLLITAAVACWNQVPFYYICGIWAALAVLSLVKIWNGSLKITFPFPIWVSALALSHVVSTLAFYGSWRFHQPFDLLLLFIAFYGLLKMAVAVTQRNAALGVVMTLVWIGLIARRFEVL